MVVEPWVVYLLVVSSVLTGGVVGCAASLLGQELRSRRAMRGVIEAPDWQRTEAPVDLDLNEDERGWLEAHGIDAG